MDFFQWNDHDENTHHATLISLRLRDACLMACQQQHTHNADPMVLFVEITTVACIGKMSKKRKIITTLLIFIYVRR